VGTTYVPGSVLRDPAVYIAVLPDADVLRPLWEFTPEERPHVVRQRRVRFQNVAEEIGDPEFS
jgi:hypothetical protein